MEDAVYFWCQSGEDGTTIKQLTRRELEERLAENARSKCQYEFMDGIPDNDGGYWQVESENVVIIKGRIIQPKAVERVTKFELPGD